MALVLTLMRTIWPSTTARTFWMLGRNLRDVIPVTFVPTPPRYLALPRWVIWLPKVVFLPVKAQTRGIQDLVFRSFQSKLGRGIVVDGPGDCKAGRGGLPVTGYLLLGASRLSGGAE